MHRARILVVDDKPSMLHLLGRILGEAYDVKLVTDGAQALSALAAQRFDAVLTDVRMPGPDGFEVLHSVKRYAPDTEVILMTAYASIPKAVEAVRAGAYDYLHKPFDPDDVALVVARALEHRRERLRPRAPEAAFEERFDLKSLFGQGHRGRELLRLFTEAVDSDAPVTLQGEVGTGHERVARAIHAYGPTREHPFVAMECAPSTSTPPAEAERPGSVEQLRAAVSQAAGGTLFLREVGRLDAATQAELLEQLQAPRASPRATAAPGGVRIIASTSLALEDEVRAGRFHCELRALLARFLLPLPALRARCEDIASLALQLLQQHPRPGRAPLQGFELEALQALTGHAWPGNLPELSAVVARAADAATGERVRLEDLPAELGRAQSSPLAPEALLQLPYREAVEAVRERVSRDYLSVLLGQFRGNVTRAAEHAGMERESLHRLLKRYGLKSEDFRGHP